MPQYIYIYIYPIYTHYGNFKFLKSNPAGRQRFVHHCGLPQLCGTGVALSVLDLGLKVEGCNACEFGRVRLLLF